MKAWLALDLSGPTKPLRLCCYELIESRAGREATQAAHVDRLKQRGVFPKEAAAEADLMDEVVLTLIELDISRTRKGGTSFICRAVVRPRIHRFLTGAAPVNHSPSGINSNDRREASLAGCHHDELTNSGIGSPSGRIGIGRPERSGTVTFLASIPRCR